MLRIFGLLCLVGGSYSASAPFVTPCKPSDGACLAASTKAVMAAFAAGVPALGIKRMDPLQLSRIHSEQAGLKLTFTDTTLTGLKDCSVESVKYDAAKQKQSISVKCSVQLTGQYKLDGQLLILPVNGAGPYSITIRDIVIKAQLELATGPGADGLPHWTIQKHRHSFKVLTGAKFDFQNLFNGNKVLAQPVHDFANGQWKDVMQEVAPPVIDAVIAELVEQIKLLYAAVPSTELAL